LLLSDQAAGSARSIPAALTSTRANFAFHLSTFSTSLLEVESLSAPQQIHKNTKEMASSNISQQGPKLAGALDPEGELTKLISNGQLTGQASAWLMTHSKRIIKWLKQTGELSRSVY